MRNSIFIALCVSLLTLALAAGAIAQPAATPAAPAKVQTPIQLVQTTRDRIIQIQNDPALQGDAKREARRARMYDVLLDGLDMDLVGNLTLGAYARKFTPAQFEQFKKLFSQLLFRTYISQLEENVGSKMHILGERRLSENKVVVSAIVDTGDKQVPIESSLARHDSKGRWLVYDTKVEGVSMVQNYRSQFREILMKKTPAEFLTQLSEKNTLDEIAREVPGANANPATKSM